MEFIVGDRVRIKAINSAQTSSFIDTYLNREGLIMSKSSVVTPWGYSVEFSISRNERNRMCFAEDELELV